VGATAATSLGRFALFDEHASLTLLTPRTHVVCHYRAFVGVKNALPSTGEQGNFESIHAALVAVVGADPQRIAVVNDNFLGRTSMRTGWNTECWLNYTKRQVLKTHPQDFSRQLVQGQRAHRGRPAKSS